jgi:hypothetical protein
MPLQDVLALEPEVEQEPEEMAHAEEVVCPRAVEQLLDGGCRLRPPRPGASSIGSQPAWTGGARESSSSRAAIAQEK